MPKLPAFFNTWLKLSSTFTNDDRFLWCNARFFVQSVEVYCFSVHCIANTESG